MANGVLKQMFGSSGANRGRKSKEENAVGQMAQLTTVPLQFFSVFCHFVIGLNLPRASRAVALLGGHVYVWWVFAKK